MPTSETSVLDVQEEKEQTENAIQEGGSHSETKKIIIDIKPEFNNSNESKHITF